jgi:hypothetical protein
VEDVTEKERSCRILIDGESEVSFMTEECLQKLGLKRNKVTVNIHGIGSSATRAKGKVTFQLRSCHNQFKINVEALVMSRITGMIPSSKVNVTDRSYLHNLDLADPEFASPHHIHILLGADVAEEIALDGRIHGPEGVPSARNTRLVGSCLVKSIRTKKSIFTPT